MHFSATSTMMAVLGGNCLICFLCIIMRDGHLAGKLSIRFLKFFSLLILLRLMLPFEFFHTISVYSENILPGIIDFCNGYVFFRFGGITLTLSRLLLAIWCGGIICKAFITLWKYLSLYHAVHRFQNLLHIPGSPVSGILESLYEEIPVRHPVKRVIRTQLVDTPCVMGFFSPTVFLPELEFTQDELYCILYHELNHLRHRDLVWMVLTEILGIIYWWNPFIAFLQTRLTDVMELHADNSAFTGLSPMQRPLYLQCLLKVARSQQKKTALPASTMPFSINAHGSLTSRMLRLTYPQPYKTVTAFIIQGVAVLLLIVSTSFIFEPAWVPENGANGEYYITDNSHFLLHEDGSYTLYIDDEIFNDYSSDDFDSLRKLEDFKTLPVYKEE